MLKYLLDEHIPPEYRTQLLHHEPALTVWMIGDEGAPPRGTLDPDILRWCDENGFTLVTNNRKICHDTLPTIWLKDTICRAFSRLTLTPRWVPSLSN